MRLDGRRILVTGAASGIGLATARLFLAEGARVAMLDRVMPPDGGAGATGRRCDITDPDAVKSAVAEAGAQMGGLDGVVNAAGCDLVRPFEATRPKDWSSVLAVNLTGAMLVCQAALAAFAGPASIVNIASAAALQPLANRSAYCAAKAGLVMFTKALALELAPRGIRANALCPGVVDTPMLRASWEGASDPDAALREVLSRPALGRLGQAGEIAEAALFLTSAACGFVNGATLAVDGGRSFH